MNWIMELFGVPLGWIMWAMYTLIPNYAIALVLFTIVTKLLLLPLAIKGQKGSVKMQIMQPKIKELQDKYKSNPQKMQEEMQLLYKRENYSMAAGCLPMLIQMPILFGLIDVIYRPLTHVMRVSSENIAIMTEIMKEANVAVSNYIEIDMLKAIQNTPEMFNELGQELVTHISSLDLMMDFGFFQIDMTQAPGFAFNILVLIPILSGATAFLMSFISMRANPSAQSANSSMKTMMYMMPLMSVWFTTMVPIGVGIYWIISNSFGAVQALVLNKFWNPKDIAEKMKLEDAERHERERQEKIEAKRLAKENGEVIEEKALSQKEINRQKLAAARKRNSELYGDYSDTDVTDEDLT